LTQRRRYFEGHGDSAGFGHHPDSGKRAEAGRKQKNGGAAQKASTPWWKSLLD